MILFISKYPSKQNEKDGMVQRIAAIDKIFGAHDRVYLDISHRRYLIPRKVNLSDEVTVYQVHMLFGVFLALYMSIFAQRVYVHSVLNAVKVLPLYFVSNKIITDMHGIVPEELEMEGRRGASRIFGVVERIAVKRSARIITVTQAMQKFLAAKYGGTAAAITVPIFDPVANAPKSEITKEKMTVIYAGGVQQWQNVDLMLRAMQSTSDRYTFVLLSGEQQILRAKCAALGISDVTIASVGKDEVYSWYANAELGFVLRDDVAVNNVACPTKLIEYLINGVVPVVIHPNIGDFNQMGYAFVTLDEFLNQTVTPGEIAAKREQNFRVVDAYQQDIAAGISQLAGLAQP